MSTAAARRPRLYYGWVVAGMTFLVLLSVSGMRAASGVMILPITTDMHWSVAQVSVAISTNVVLFGAMGPFAAAIMHRYGVRRSMLVALVLMAISTALTSRITTPFQFWLTWGLGVGVGVGTLSMVLASVVATRWFVRHRGLVQGLMTSANASGQLVFLPALAWITTQVGWRPVGLIVAALAIAVAIPVGLFMRDRPEDLGLVPLGADPGARPVARDLRNPLARAFAVLRRSIRNRDFLLVGGTFFVCGASTNGLIGTHFIPACGDHGIPEVQAASMLAAIGIFNIMGTTLSGWLSDRYASGPLLAIYYGTRGISLVVFAWLLDAGAFWVLPFFMVFYGLDWLTTGAPNLRALSEALGRDDAPIAFGWIGVIHAVGSGAIALGAGLIRTEAGSYTGAFLASATLCFVACIASLGIGRKRARGDDGEPRAIPATA